MGAEILAIPKGCPYEATGAILSGSAIGYSIDTDLMEQARETIGVAEVSGVIMGQRGAGKNNKVIVFNGIDENFFVLKPQFGFDGVVKKGEVVLGYHASKLLGVEPGDTLQIAKRDFEVTHIFDEFGSNDDLLVLMEISDAWELLNVDSKLSSVLIKLDDPDDAEIVSARLMEIPDLQVITVNEFYETVSGFIDGAKMAVSAVLLIVLLIAFIGIILAQTSSTIQRRGEIGMMRAIGASKTHMFFVSLISAGFLGLIGSLVGVFLGFVFSGSIENLIRTTLPQAPNGSIIQINVQIMLITVLLMAVVSVLAGLVPTLQIVKIRPVEAISE
ncbi:MAG: FtsX-like permease family protein [Caldisericia bacterium]